MNSPALRLPETRKPIYFYPLLVFSLMFTLPYLVGYAMPLYLELAIFAVFVTLTGIPHGAVDHLVAADVFGLELKWRDQLRFFGAYLGAMILFGLIWIVSPVTGFIIFLMISVYHFGQGDLSWLELPAVPGVILYLSRGVMLLVLPVAGHLDTTSPIIFEAIGTDLMQSPFLIQYANMLVAFALVQHVLLIAVIPVIFGAGFQWKELLLSLALGFILITTHPLVGFGIYFGIWHALNHFFELRDHLWSRMRATGMIRETTSTSGFWWFYKKTIPFTLISFVGLALLWMLMGSFGVREKMISLLFIMISVLTLPHMVVVHFLFRRGRPSSP
jgi:beta-carotene 15,15'-dioxygenase